MSRAGYSYSTIKLIHTLLYPALEMAVDDDIIRKNPAKGVLSGDYGRTPAEKNILILELPRISAHNLRHTACTNIVKQGMNVKVLHISWDMPTVM